VGHVELVVYTIASHVENNLVSNAPTEHPSRMTGPQNKMRCSPAVKAIYAIMQIACVSYYLSEFGIQHLLPTDTECRVCSASFR
jgi:hypothetical protein